MYLGAHRDIFAFDSAPGPTRAAVVCTFYLFMLRSSIGCRAARRSNSFLIISVWRVIKKNQCCSFCSTYQCCQEDSRSLRFFFGHLKSREVRCWQVTQVVLGGSVSSCLLLHQRCSLCDRRQFIFFAQENSVATKIFFSFNSYSLRTFEKAACLLFMYWTEHL